MGQGHHDFRRQGGLRPCPYDCPVAIALLLALPLVHAAHSQERIALRYGEIANSVHNISSVPLAIAQRKGFLDREGIDLKVVPLGGARAQVDALDKGEVDVTHTATLSDPGGARRGFDSVGVIGGPANTVYEHRRQARHQELRRSRRQGGGDALPVDTISDRKPACCWPSTG